MIEMTQKFDLVLYAFASGLATWGITSYFIKVANLRNFFDLPNLRSSHKNPVPKGGGLVFMTIILVGWFLLSITQNSPVPQIIIISAAAIAVLSFIDDVRPLSPWFRLFVQALLCAAALNTLAEDQSVFHADLPFSVDRFLAFIALIWFCNLYNFMDGIDGIAASEALFICIALILIGGAVGWHFHSYGAVIIGAMIAFLYYNWSPAKIFMGDVGSIGLGFLLGYLLLQLAISGGLIAALIIPMYFVFDTTMILLIRMYRGYQMFIPHRTFSIHHSVDGGRSHAGTVRVIMITNVVLFALAYSSLIYPGTSFLAALVLTYAVWWGLRKIVRKSPQEASDAE